MNYLLCTLITGFIATAVMDLWGVARKPLLGWPVADYRLIGRWISYLPRGKSRHDAISRTPAVDAENAVGWLAHYALGLGFAAAFIGLVGMDWLVRPTALPALAFGVATVLVPFTVLQPAMGLGFAASRAPKPAAARLQSLVTHTVFGLGLYLGGWTAHAFNTPGG